MARTRATLGAICAVALLLISGCSSKSDTATETSTHASILDPASEQAGPPATYVSPIPTAATTEVPPSVPGDISQTVPEVELTTGPSVNLSQQASFGNGVSVAIDKLESITTKGRLPGDISGPGIAVTLRFSNTSTKSIDLQGVVVTLTDSTAAPGIPSSQLPTNPISGSLSPGSDSVGTYAFTVPVDARTPITINISYSTEAPSVLLVGNAA